MKIPTNSSIIDWLSKYAFFAVLVIAALFITKSLVASTIKSIHSATLSTCTLSGLERGEVSTYHGKQFKVDDFRAYEYDWIDDSLSISLEETNETN